MDLVRLMSKNEAKPQYYFPEKDEEQIKSILKERNTISLEKLLKYIYKRYDDEGLRYTLLHKIYQATIKDIQYYVPELVYFVIKKQCKPMKTVLIDKATESESLRRLVNTIFKLDLMECESVYSANEAKRSSY